MSKKARVFKSSIIDDVLNTITPEEQLRTDHRMLLAAKIAEAIKAKGWKKKDFREAMGQKYPSVITKWLSGTHNFTTDTLTDIGRVLGINLLNLNSEVAEPKAKLSVTKKVKVEENEYTNILSVYELDKNSSPIVRIEKVKSNHSKFAMA